MPEIAGRLFERFLATADHVSRERPEVDLELAREVFHEAATLLHNGLVLDDLDDHDLDSVIAGLCRDLAADDPGEAIREHARVATDAEGLNDPDGVSAAYLMAASTLQL